MKQNKMMVVSESLFYYRFLSNDLSNWGMQTLEVNDPPSLAEVRTLSPQLIFIEKKLYNHCDYLRESAFGTLGAAAPGIIVLVHSNENLSSLAGADHHDILPIPYSQSTLFRTVRQALCLREFESNKTSVSRKISYIHDNLTELFDQVARMQEHAASSVSAAGTELSFKQNVTFNQANEVIRRIRQLAMSLLKDAKRVGPLHPYETQLLLLNQYIDELGLDQSKVGTQSRSITELLKSHPLSRKELKVVSMINSGMTTEEIAENLYISPDTVKCHRRNIRKKLKLVGSKYSLGDFMRSLDDLSCEDIHDKSLT